MDDFDVIVPPTAPPRPRGRIVAEWRAPGLQDPQHTRPDERAPPLPEFDDEIEAYLFWRRRRPLHLPGGGDD